MLIQGDARSLPIRAGSVDCVVTSPPYFGLRDYGTASWVGGDPGCDHRKVSDVVAAVATSTLGGGKKTTGHQQEGFVGYCGKCGARRVDAQIGLEADPEAYVAAIVGVFAEVRRVLKDGGVLWLNLGDSYAAAGGAHGGRQDNQGGVGARRTHRAGGGDKEPRRPPAGIKAKDLLGIPWRVAFALQADGWYLRSDVIWAKPNPMPESVTDRPTKAHEYLFLLAKSEQYHYDADAIKEPVALSQGGGVYGSGNKARNLGDERGRPGSHLGGSIPWEGDSRNKRSVWTVPTMPYDGAHFATMPEALVEPCILAGCPVGGIVLDPFIGSGTVGAVAERLGRRWVGVDLSYQGLARKRTAQKGLRF